MKAEDVKQTLDEALVVAQTHAPPKLLSDNESGYLSVELAEYLNDRNMKHVRSRPLHPQTQGKIEQYHSCLLYTSPSPRDVEESRMPSSA